MCALRARRSVAGMDSHFSQQLVAIRQAEALEQAAAARAARAQTHGRRVRLTAPRARVMIAMWRAGSRAR
jgi:hypothetical protein